MVMQGWRRAGLEMKTAIASVKSWALLLGFLLMCAVVCAGQTQGGKHANAQQAGDPNVVREVPHQLQVLPYYSVFDHIAFTFDGRTVILTGNVLRPTLKK